MWGDLPRSPKFRSACVVVPLGTDQVLVRSAGIATVMRGVAAGELLPHLLPLLDGSRTVEQIVAQLPTFREVDVVSVLRSLHASALVHEADEDHLSPDDRERHHDQLQFFSGYAMGHAADAQRRLGQARVGVMGLGGAGAEAARQLAHVGLAEIRIADPDPGVTASVEARLHADLDGQALRTQVVRANVDPEAPALDSLTDGLSVLVVHEDRWTADVLGQVNRHCIGASLPWLIFRVDGEGASVGPLFLPKETACLTCFRRRRRGVEDFLDAYDAFEAVRPGVVGRLGTMPGVAALVAGLVVVEVVKLLTDIESPASMGAELRFSLSSCRVEPHRVLKLPRCPDCGVPQPHRPQNAIWMAPDA